MSPDASSNLERALDAIPEEKKEDLVFLQRGDMIEPTLKKRGLARERQTQAVLYYGLNEFGKIEDDRCSIGEDAMGQQKFAAESCVTGKWAGAVADRCRRAGFFCAEFFHRDWRRQMIEAVVFEVRTTWSRRGAQARTCERGPRILRRRGRRHALRDPAGLRGHLAVTLLSGFEEGWRLMPKRTATVEDGQSTIVVFWFVTLSQRRSTPFRLDALAREFDPSPTHHGYTGVRARERTFRRLDKWQLMGRIDGVDTIKVLQAESQGQSRPWFDTSR